KLLAAHDVSLGEPPFVEAAHGDFGEVDDGPRAADRQLDRKVAQSLESAHRAGPNVPLDAGVLRRRHGSRVAGAKEHSRQADGPEFERVEKTVLLLIADDDFGAAASHVDEQGLPAANVGPARDPQIDQPGLFFPGDDADVDAGNPPQMTEEAGPVLGFAG